MFIFKSRDALSVMAQYLPENPVIVEIGAFDGNDTIQMARKWPKATVYAFEPVDEIYERLKNNTKNLSNIYCYNMAVSDTDGIASFYVAEKPHKVGIASQAGSLRKPKERLVVSPITFPRIIQVQTIRLDAWMQEHSVYAIDLLWIDTQGHELTILKAAQNVLKNIRIIFAEVSFIESYEGQEKYEEVVEWIESQGFIAVARDFEIPSEKSFFGNVLFVRQDLA